MWVLLFKTDCIPCFQGKLICTTKHRLYPLTTEKSKGSKGGDKECSSLLNESLTNLILTMSPKMHFTSQYQQGDFFLLLLPLKKFLTSVIQDSHSNKNQESSLRLWAISCNTSLLTAAFQHCLPSATERPTSNTEVTISCCCYLWKPQKQKHCSSHRGKKKGQKKTERERKQNEDFCFASEKTFKVCTYLWHNVLKKSNNTFHIWLFPWKQKENFSLLLVQKWLGIY